MKILKPIQFTDSTLTSTNVHEVAPAIYVAGTTYADSDFAHVVNGLALDIYESLQAANTGHDPATESSWWAYRSSTYPEYVAGTTYGSGDIVIMAADHLVYESLQAANTGKTPGTDTEWWLEVSATNPWKPFDQKVGSQISRTGSIYYEILPGAVEGVALFNITATSINITLTDPTAGDVYNQTIDLIDTTVVFDWYSYFFGEFLLDKNVAVTDIPNYPNATLEITLLGDSDTDTVKCGEIIFGLVKYVGATQYAPNMEIIDYSKKETDDFGNFIITERAFTKRVTVDLVVKNPRITFVQNLFEENRAIPVVYIPTEVDDLADPYLTYGFYNRFSLVTKYLSHSIISVEIIGLT